MAYDADLPIQVQDEAHFRQQRCAANAHSQPTNDTEDRYVIGSWYLDELGNKTREITARD